MTAVLIQPLAEWGPAVALVVGPWVAFAIWCRK